MSHSRHLTDGEVALARSMFGDTIDYDRVRIIRGKWWPFQPSGIVMAPTGNIHFHPRDPRWSEDFSEEDIWLQGLFIHEMTHVMQAHQQGRLYLPLMRHPFCRYAFELRDGKPFRSYGFEKQAEIMRHIFLLRRGATMSNHDQLAALAKQLPFGNA